MDSNSANIPHTETDAAPSPPAAPQAAPAPPPPPSQGPTAPPGPPGYQWAYVPPPAVPKPPRRLSGCLVAAVVVLAMVLLVVAIITVMGYMLGRPSMPVSLVGGGTVGMISISGVIRSDDDISLFGVTSHGAYAIMKQLQEAADDPAIKAVVLRVNSPGGSAAASQGIYTEVKRLAQKKPVVASMGDVAASGGYYVCAPATVIMASPATITGSIGVINQSINWSGLANRYGVRDETITSGPYKDTMNPFRPMRDDERAVMRALVTEVFEQFVTDVTEGRKAAGMTREKVRKLADGRVFSGSQAKRVGLVDELGNLRDAILLAAKKSGISGEPRVKEFGRGRGLYGLLQEIAPKAPSGTFDAMMQSYLTLGPGLWMIMQANQVAEAK